MSLNIDRKQLSKVFGSHQEIVQFEQALSNIDSLSAQASALALEIETAQAQITQVLADLQAITDSLGDLKLGSLNDVSSAVPLNDDLLKFDSVSGQWIPASSVIAGITDTTGNLISSGVDLTNGSGSDIATLNTAPVSGDPTKWVPIDDNGTTRYLPVW